MGPPRSWQLTNVVRDGRYIWKLRCPRCGTWADLDDDQYHGRVSIECSVSGCTFHETADLSAFEE